MLPRSRMLPWYTVTNAAVVQRWAARSRSPRRDDRGDHRRIPRALIRLVGAAHPDDGRPAILPVRNQGPQVVEGRVAREGCERPLPVPAALAAKQLVVPRVVCGADEGRAGHRI